MPLKNNLSISMEQVKPMRKLVSFSIDVLKRTPLFQQNPDLLLEMERQYRNAPRLKNGVKMLVTKELIAAADGWIKDKISDEEFIRYCGKKPSNSKTAKYGNETMANALYKRIVKAKINDRVIQ